VRVTAQLLDARNDAHLWAQSYERSQGEILEIQDSVALDIVIAVSCCTLCGQVYDCPDSSAWGN
jgi:TolB-like protein